MKRFVALGAALLVAACDSGSSGLRASPEENASLGGEETAANLGGEETAAKKEAYPACPGNNSISTGDLVSNYGMLVGSAIQAQIPGIGGTSDFSPLLRHVRDNEDLAVRFIQEGGSCRIWYKGSTLFEGTSYRFEGKCDAERDGQSPDGSNDWKAKTCTAERLPILPR